MDDQRAMVLPRNPETGMSLRQPTVDSAMSVPLRGGRLFPSPVELDAIERIATFVVNSGIAQAMELKSTSDISMVILKGWALDIDAMSALEGIKMIKGKPWPTGPFLAALGTRVGGKIEWVSDGRDGRAECIAHRPGHTPKRGTFTKEDAVRAKLTSKDTYQQYEPDMLRSRALSRATRLQFIDLYFGFQPIPADHEWPDELEEEPMDDEPSMGTSTPSAEAPSAPKRTRAPKATPAASAPPAANGTPTSAPQAAAPPPESTAPAVAPPVAPPPVAQQSVTSPQGPLSQAAPQTPPPSPASTGAVPVGNVGAPPDAPLAFSKGEYVGKKLSDLTEPDFKKMIPGYRLSVNNPNTPPERRAANEEWLKSLLAWAAFRGVLVP